ncbi:MAG: type II toxin-antitoxin system Phd/YefM family antitoxin [Brevundimonas sp.]
MELGVFEARNRFSERVEAAERGEETIVLKHGKAVARLVPMADQSDLALSRKRALEIARRAGAEITARNGRRFTHDELIEGRDEGRR